MKPLWSPGEQPTGTLFGDLQFIVAGVNRGGTTFTSNVLASLGLRSRHEGLLTNDCICRHYSRYFDCEVSGGNVHMLPQARDAGLPIFHLLRHPIGTLDSLWSLWRDRDYFKTTYWIGDPDDEPVVAMGRWWMEHRQKIEAMDPVRLYLEKPAEIFWKIGRVMEYDWDAQAIADAIAENGPRKQSPRTVPKESWFVWQDLPDEVQRYAAELGYEEVRPGRVP